MAKIFKLVFPLEALLVRIARENRSWGYDRIVGALTKVELPPSPVMAFMTSAATARESQDRRVSSTKLAPAIQRSPLERFKDRS
jgi:hypothetical protein